MNTTKVRTGEQRGANAATIGIVWIGGVVLVSALPDIVFRALTGASASPLWLPAVVLLLLLLLLVVVTRSSAQTHLRGFVWSLVGLAAGYLFESLVEHSAPWISWNRALPVGASFVLVNAAKLIPVTTLALSLVGSRLSRTDLFLRFGNLRTPFVRLTGRINLTWAVLLPVALVLSVGPVVANVIAARHPDFGLMPRLLALVPLIVGGAAINTFAEEFLFRQVLLARLIPLVGIGQAVWLTSVRFGVGHWFGNPSGLTGVLLATVFGWFAARSMVETRGSAWSWSVHLINDIVIFSLIALTTARWV